MDVKTWLQNHTKFMNEVNFLAQAGHLLWGVASVVSAAYLGGKVEALIMAGLNVIYAAVKEFWFDATYELPKQTSKDNWTDFSFYCVGCVIGLGITFVKFL